MPCYKTTFTVAYNFARLESFRLNFSYLIVCLRLSSFLENFSQNCPAISKNEHRGKRHCCPTEKKKKREKQEEKLVILLDSCYFSALWSRDLKFGRV